MTTEQEEVLAISSSPEEVAVMLHEIAVNRPEIASFLESLGPQTAFTVCAWFLGQLISQDPGLMPAFKEALECGIQVAGVMRAQYDKDNPGFSPEDGAYVILYPAGPSNESQLSLPSALIQ